MKIFTIQRGYPPTQSKAVVTRRMKNLLRVINRAMITCSIRDKNWVETLNLIKMERMIWRDGTYAICHVHIPDSAADYFIETFVKNIRSYGNHKYELYLTGTYSEV